MYPPPGTRTRATGEHNTGEAEDVIYQFTREAAICSGFDANELDLLISTNDSDDPKRKGMHADLGAGNDGVASDLHNATDPGKVRIVKERKSIPRTPPGSKAPLKQDAVGPVQMIHLETFKAQPKVVLSTQLGKTTSEKLRIVNNKSFAQKVTLGCPALFGIDPSEVDVQAHGFVEVTISWVPSDVGLAKGSVTITSSSGFKSQFSVLGNAIAPPPPKKKSVLKPRSGSVTSGPASIKPTARSVSVPRRASDKENVKPRANTDTERNAPSHASTKPALVKSGSSHDFASESFRPLVAGNLPSCDVVATPPRRETYEVPKEIRQGIKAVSTVAHTRGPLEEISHSAAEQTFVPTRGRKKRRSTIFEDSLEGAALESPPEVCPPQEPKLKQAPPLTPPTPKICEARFRGFIPRSNVSVAALPTPVPCGDAKEPAVFPLPAAPVSEGNRDAQSKTVVPVPRITRSLYDGAIGADYVACVPVTAEPSDNSTIVITRTQGAHDESIMSDMFVPTQTSTQIRNPTKRKVQDFNDSVISDFAPARFSTERKSERSRDAVSDQPPRTSLRFALEDTESTRSTERFYTANSISEDGDHVDVTAGAGPLAVLISGGRKLMDISEVRTSDQDHCEDLQKRDFECLVEKSAEAMQLNITREIMKSKNITPRPAALEIELKELDPVSTTANGQDPATVFALELPSVQIIPPVITEKDIKAPVEVQPPELSIILEESETGRTFEKTQSRPASRAEATVVRNRTFDCDAKSESEKTVVIELPVITNVVVAISQTDSSETESYYPETCIQETKSESEKAVVIELPVETKAPSQVVHSEAKSGLPEALLQEAKSDPRKEVVIELPVVTKATVAPSKSVRSGAKSCFPEARIQSEAGKEVVVDLPVKTNASVARSQSVRLGAKSHYPEALIQKAELSSIATRSGTSSRPLREDFDFDADGTRQSVESVNSQVQPCEAPKPSLAVKRRTAPSRPLPLPMKKPAPEIILLVGAEPAEGYRQIFYDEKGPEKQFNAWKVWMNYVLTPVEDLWSLKKIREDAIQLYGSSLVREVVERLEKEIKAFKFAIRTDKPINKDSGLKSTFIQLLLNYSPFWLRLGLETVFGQVIHISGNPIVSLKKFINERLLNDPETHRSHSHPTVPNSFKPGYDEALRIHTLSKFFYLVYFLDIVKEQRLVSHNPCLFRKESVFKKTADLLTSFSRDFLSKEGDVVKHLSCYGWKTHHEQRPLDEYDFSVSDLAKDLIDGIRLCRVLEILLNRNDLVNSLRQNVGSRTNKVYNVKIALQALSDAGKPIPSVDVQDIVNGDKAKISELMRHLIFEFQLDQCLDPAKIEFENAYLAKSLRFRAKTAPEAATCLRLIESPEAAKSVADLVLDEKMTNLFRWVRLICAHQGIKVRNFGASFADGRVLCCLISHYHPDILRQENVKSETTNTIWSETPYPSFTMVKPDEKIIDNLVKNEKENFSLFSQKLLEIGGVPPLLVATDVVKTLPEKTVIAAFVGFLFLRMTDISEEVHAVRKIQLWFRQKLMARRDKELAEQIAAEAKRAEEARKRESAAIVLQKNLRVVLAKRLAEKLRVDKQIALEAAERARKQKEEEETQAAVVLQKAGRAFIVRRRLEKLKREREEELIRAAKSEKENRSALVIQTNWRRVSAQNQLTRLKECVRKNSAALVIQTNWRRVSAQNQLKHLKECIRKNRAALVIQTNWRRVSAENQLKRLKEEVQRQYDAVLVIQTNWRRTSAQKQLNRLKEQRQRQHDAAVLIQTNWRRVSAQKQLNRLKEQRQRQHDAAVLIQSNWRRVSAQKQLNRLKERRQRQHDAVFLIQTNWRRVSAQKQLNRLKEQTQRQYDAAVLIQTNWRRVSAQKQLNRLKEQRQRQHEAAAVIQTNWRRVSAQNQLMRLKKEVQRLHDAALVIQTNWRRVFAQNQLKRLKEDVKHRHDAARTIQTNFRRVRAKKQVKRLQQAVVRNKAALVIQTNWRRCLAQKEGANLKRARQLELARTEQDKKNSAEQEIREREQSARKNSAARIIQTHWRLVSAQNQLKRLKEDLKRQHDAARTVQTNFRRMLAKKKVKRLQQALVRNKAAVIIQTSWRRWLAQKERANLNRALQLHLAQMEQEDMDSAEQLREDSGMSQGCSVCSEDSMSLPVPPFDEPCCRTCGRAFGPDAYIQQPSSGVSAELGNSPHFPVRTRRSASTVERDAAATKIQALWRGYAVRKKNSQHLQSIRDRVQQQSATADDRATLGARTRSAIAFIFRLNSLELMKEALINLSVSTKLSDVCCRIVVAENGVEKLCDLIFTTNKSLPAQECICYALDILTHLGLFDETRPALVRSPDIVKTLLNTAVRFKQNADSVFTRACHLVSILASFTDLKLKLTEHPEYKRVLTLRPAQTKFARSEVKPQDSVFKVPAARPTRGETRAEPRDLRSRSVSRSRLEIPVVETPRRRSVASAVEGNLVTPLVSRVRQALHAPDFDPQHLAEAHVQILVPPVNLRRSVSNSSLPKRKVVIGPHWRLRPNETVPTVPETHSRAVTVMFEKLD